MLVARVRYDGSRRSHSVLRQPMPPHTAPLPPRRSVQPAADAPCSRGTPVTIATLPSGADTGAPSGPSRSHGGNGSGRSTSGKNGGAVCLQGCRHQWGLGVGGKTGVRPGARPGPVTPERSRHRRDGDRGSPPGTHPAAGLFQRPKHPLPDGQARSPSTVMLPLPPQHGADRWLRQCGREITRVTRRMKRDPPRPRSAAPAKSCRSSWRRLRSGSGSDHRSPAPRAAPRRMVRPSAGAPAQ